jgi:hypothetical protein
MTKPSMSRVDYCISSITGFAVLAAVFFVTLSLTMGWQGLLSSSPGKARGLLVFVTTIGAFLCAFHQSKIARLRAAETNINRIFVWVFVALLYVCAFGYSAELFYRDFVNPKNNEGSLAGFALALCAFWACLATAKGDGSGYVDQVSDTQRRETDKIDLSRALGSRKKH